MREDDKYVVLITRIYINVGFIARDNLLCIEAGSQGDRVRREKSGLIQ